MPVFSMGNNYAKPGKYLMSAFSYIVCLYIAIRCNTLVSIFDYELHTV